MSRAAMGGIAVSLLLSACGVEAPTPAEEAETGSVEAAIIPECKSTSAYYIRWYSDFNRTKEVGRDDCNCGVVTPHGTHGPYYSVQWLPSCLPPEM